MARNGEAKDETGRFTGFRPEALQFLADLAVNNERAWFTPRKAEFERLLKEPMEALCAALAEAFPRHGVPLGADARRSPFRIHRDTRFSKDKTPYKIAHSSGFPWAGGRPTSGAAAQADTQGDADAVADVGTAAGGGRADRRGGRGEERGPGGYFHLQPGEISVGGGMWHPEPPTLAAFRRLVDLHPGGVETALEDPGFVAEFGTVDGERLSRVPQGYPKDHPRAELLKLKDVVFSRRLADEDVFSPSLPDTIAASLARAVPVFRLLASLHA